MGSDDDDPESLLRNRRDKHCPGVSSVRNSTITCGLPSVLLGNSSVPKPCCSHHVTLTDVIDHSCESVSRLTWCEINTILDLSK